MSAGQFENFKPGLSGNLEKALINGCPVVITKGPNGQERATMNINNRFLVVLVVENQSQGAAKTWASAVDVTKLVAASRASPLMSKLPSEVQIEFVDELNPSKNRKVVQAIRTSR